MAYLTSVAWGQRLQPSDFGYMGAFAIDGNYSTTNNWKAYGQRGMSFDSTGDPGNSDAYPGSLWVTGHDYDRHVFELSIPTPSSSTFNFGQLPKPSLLTVPTRFTNACSGDTDWFAGVEVHGSHIWGSCVDWYNVTGNDAADIMWRRNLSDLSNLQGPFHAGPIGDPLFHSNRQGMYMLSIPAAWAAAHHGANKTLATGLNRNAHAGQMGPTILTFDPDNPADGYPLLYYRQRDACYDDKNQCDYPEYTACDIWNSATWVRTPTTDTVLVAGKKYDGETTYNGGWYCEPGFGEIAFYDADDLAARVDGSLQPWEVVPYATWRPAEMWGSQHEFGGISFDPVGGYLYAIETSAGPAGMAIVHVYKTEGGSNTDYTLTVTRTGAGIGTVTSSPGGINCGADCQQTYAQGTAVQLIATPGGSSYFAGWSGNADCTDGVVTLNADRDCTARFEPGEPETHTLSVSKTGTGTGRITSSPAGVNCGSDCSEEYIEGTVVQLNSAPDEGVYFAGWSGDSDCSDGTVTLSADRDCVATFIESTGSLGLVAAYGFDEGTGSTLSDASGQGNQGSITGATWTTQGYFGSALFFDGNGDMVLVPDADVLDLTTGMTLEAWIRPAGLSGWDTVIMKQNGSSLAYTLYAYDNAPQPALYIDVDGEKSAAGSFGLPLYTWSHLAGTYDGASLRLYVNGQQVGSRSVSGAIETTFFPLAIGGNTIWGEFFLGRIDEIRVYDRALTQAEIQSDMNSPVSDPRFFGDGFESGNTGAWSLTVQ